MDPRPPSEPGQSPTEGQGGVPPVEQPTSETVGTFKPGLVERLDSARNQLGALEQEAERSMQELTHGLRSVAKKAVSELPVTAITIAREPEKMRVEEVSDKPSVIRQDREEVRDGVFVSGDGKSVKLHVKNTGTFYQPIDETDTKSVEFLTSYYGKDMASIRRRYMELHVPDDPELIVSIDSLWNPNSFIIRRGTSKDEDDQIKVGRRNDGRVGVEVGLFASDIGDPFDIVRRTLDFTKSATLKPVENQAQTPPPTPPAQPAEGMPQS